MRVESKSSRVHGLSHLPRGRYKRVANTIDCSLTLRRHRRYCDCFRKRTQTEIQLRSLNLSHNFWTEQIYLNGVISQNYL
jgi:hypothetical protein